MTEEQPKIPYDRDPMRAEFHGLEKRGMVFSFNNAGAPISRPLRWTEEPVAVRRNGGAQFRLPLDLKGAKGAIYLPLGLTVISGATQAGKSSFLKALRTALPLIRLNVVEPHDDPDEIESTPTFSSVDSALVAAVSQAYTNPSTLMALDSLRAPLFELTGNAGSKGVVMPFFTQLTRVSNDLAMAGISLLATVNPMDEDPAYVDSFLKKLSAAMPATILINSASGKVDDRQFEGTISLRPDRTPIPFSFRAGSVKAPTRDTDTVITVDVAPFDNSNLLSFNRAASAIDKAI